MENHSFKIPPVLNFKNNSEDTAHLCRMKKFNLSLTRESLSRGDIYLKSMPIDMNIETTLKCNLKCRICQRQIIKRVHFYRAMELDLFKKIVQESFLYLKNVSLTLMGEPLLSENLYGVLDIIKGYSVGLELITNGIFLNNDFLILRLLDVLSYINISLDAISKETYMFIRTNGDFDTLIDNIKRFNRLKQQSNNKPLLSLSFTAMRKSIEELPRFVHLAKSLGADIITVSHLRVYNKKMEKESLVCHKDMANNYFKLAGDEAKKLGIRLVIPRLYAKEDGCPETEFLEVINDNPVITEKIAFCSISNSARCRFLWAKVFISTEGNVFPCCSGGDQRPIMGNILKQPLREIWNNGRYMKMRQSFLTGKLFDCCKKCPENPLA